MKKRTKFIFAGIETLLFAGEIVFTNDWISEHTSYKIAPLLAEVFLLTLLFTVSQGRE